MNIRRILQATLLCLAASTVGLALEANAIAGPPPFADPSAMSGIPRPDPKLAPGVVTVRCLGKAGFSAPAVDLDVTLTVTTAGGETKTFTAKTQEQGRATFDGLAELTGASAVASATLGGATVSSRSIPLLAQAGTAVMLVEGASAPAKGPGPTAKPGAAAGAPEIPAPGNAFPLSGTPKGTLTIGTFDLAARKPVGDVELELTVTVPDADPEVRTGKTDARGKFVFDKLDTLPEGTMLVVEGTLVEGGELRKSAPFKMAADSGMALVLAEGAEHFVAPPTQAQAGAQPTGPRKLPGPRILQSLPEGVVQVSLFNAIDGPIADQSILVVKRTATGATQKFRAKTGPQGTVSIPDVPAQPDSLYFVEVMYDGAPYQSTFFGMDSRGGVAVDLRLFETTADPSVVRSALQYDVSELENDMSQVVQIYEVMVSGDKAFWDPKFEIHGPDGAKAFTVLRPAEEMLDHEEKAPFARLHGPIPPGSLTNLSVGYLLPHDGDVEVSWTPPFEVVQNTVLVSDNLELVAAGATQTDLEAPFPGKTVWDLPKVKPGETVELTMTGLRIRNPLFRKIGIGGGIALAMFALLGIVLGKRKSNIEQLRDRKQDLTRLLQHAKAGSEERIQAVAALDQVVRQLEVLESGASAAEPRNQAHG